jgi:hypothetical protein
MRAGAAGAQPKVHLFAGRDHQMGRPVEPDFRRDGRRAPAGQFGHRSVDELIAGGERVGRHGLGARGQGQVVERHGGRSFLRTEELGGGVH